MKNIIYDNIQTKEFHYFGVKPENSVNKFIEFDNGVLGSNTFYLTKEETRELYNSMIEYYSETIRKENV